MLQLLLASGFFLGLHLGVSGTRLRDSLIETLGEKPFKLIFSASAALGLIWLILAWHKAPYLPLWGSPRIFRYLALLSMPLSFYLAVAAVTTQPAGEATPYGVLRITRHPLMWAIALWAGVHLLANGDGAAVIFFGTFLALAVKGTFDLDRKRLRESSGRWQAYLEHTSNVPFLAIASGKQQLAGREIGGWRIALALILYLAMLHAHAKLFGVDPLG
jgi:uncharacterized membrane protein